MGPESRHGRSCGSSINMKLAARAILKIDCLRHECCANLIALQTPSQSFQLLTVPICRPPWEKCIIHQRYHCKAERCLGRWLRPRTCTQIVDITFTLTSLTPALSNPSLRIFISCAVHVESVAQEARQGAWMPLITDISKHHRHTKSQAHRKNLVEMGVNLGICQCILTAGFIDWMPDRNPYIGSTCPH